MFESAATSPGGTLRRRPTTRPRGVPTSVSSSACSPRGWEREGQGAIWYETHFVRGAPGMATATIATRSRPPSPHPSRSRSREQQRRTSRRARSLLVAKRELTLAALACVILAATFVVVGAAPSERQARRDARHFRPSRPPGPRTGPAASRGRHLSRARSSPTCASRPSETAPGSRYGAAPARERCSTRACWFRGHSCTSARHVYGPGWVRPATFRSLPTAVRSRSEAPTTRCSCPRLRSRKARARARQAALPARAQIPRPTLTKLARERLPTTVANHRKERTILVSRSSGLGDRDLGVDVLFAVRRQQPVQLGPAAGLGAVGHFSLR